MNYEALFATSAVYIGTVLVTAIMFYFKGHRDGIMEAINYVKKEESEDDE